MPIQHYPLTLGGPKVLTVSWSGPFRNLTAQLRGVTLLTIPTAKELREGRSALLPDGQVLKVRLRPGISGQVQVMVNDRDVTTNLLVDDAGVGAGAEGPVDGRLQTAYSIIFFIAGASSLVGAIAYFFEIEALIQLGAGVEMMIFGAVFAVLGFFVRSGSRIALLLAILIFVADSFFMLMAAIESGGGIPTGGYVTKAFFVLGMLRGLPATRWSRSEPNSRPVEPPRTLPTASASLAEMPPAPHSAATSPLPPPPPLPPLPSNSMPGNS